MLLNFIFYGSVVLYILTYCCSIVQLVLTNFVNNQVGSYNLQSTTFSSIIMNQVLLPHLIQQRVYKRKLLALG